MLKVHPKFRVYDITPQKAVKSLIQASFISDETLAPIFMTWTWRAIAKQVFDYGLLEYHTVRIHKAPVAEPSLDDGTVYYDVEGVSKPMTLNQIFSRFKSTQGNFVAICHKVKGKLVFSGFVH